MNSFNLKVSADFDNLIGPLANKSSGNVTHLPVGNVSNNLGSVMASKPEASNDPNNINANASKVSSNTVEDSKFAQVREEQSRKINEKNNSKLAEIPERTEPESFNYNELEFNEKNKAERENLEILLQDLYTEAYDPESILSDQKANEINLEVFFKNHPPSKTDALAITLAGFYLAFNDLKSAQYNLERIRNPDLIDDNYENASYHRAYYFMQANLEIERNDLDKAKELLKQGWNIQQKHFLDYQENFLDFYATSMGRIHLKERNLKEAEKCFNDALALRLFAKNSRLISSSYNDLALLYIEKRNEQALQYLNKASEYDAIFKKEARNNRSNLLSGQVDLKRPDLAKTREAYNKLQI